METEAGHIVLNRKIGESILIGDNVEIKIFQIGRDRVRLRITAPKSVAVDRAEVRARKQLEDL